MYTYKFIKEDEYFYFIIKFDEYEVGRSIAYNSLRECERTYKFFLDFIKVNKINNYKSPFITIDNEGGKKVFLYVHDGDVIFFKVVNNNHVSYYKKIIKSLYEHVISGDIN